MTDLEKVELAMRRASDALRKSGKGMSARIIRQVADELVSIEAASVEPRYITTPWGLFEPSQGTFKAT